VCGLHCTLLELVDGTSVCSYSEAWRHECEARTILAMRSNEGRRGALLAIARLRGKQSADRLQDTMIDLSRKAGHQNE
jgi:hypothetical protein